MKNILFHISLFFFSALSPVLGSFICSKEEIIKSVRLIKDEEDYFDKQIKEKNSLACTVNMHLETDDSGGYKSYFWAGLDWEHDYCLDNKTLVIGYQPPGSEYGHEIAKTFKIVCVSTSPIDFEFQGKSPNLEMKDSQYFKRGGAIFRTSIHKIIVDVPRKPINSGNYVFHLYNVSNYTESLYVYFTPSSKPYLVEAGNKMEHPLKSYSKNTTLYIPCRSSSPDTHVDLFKIENATLIWKTEMAVYHPKIGFEINTTAIKNTREWTGFYFCSTDYPFNSDSVYVKMEPENESSVVSFDKQFKTAERKHFGKIEGIGNGKESYMECLSIAYGNKFEYISSVYAETPFEAKTLQICLLKNADCQPQSSKRRDCIYKYGDDIFDNRGPETEYEQPSREVCTMSINYTSGLVGCFGHTGYIYNEFFKGLNGIKYFYEDWKESPLEALVTLKLKEDSITSPINKTILIVGKHYRFECSFHNYIFISTVSWQLRLRGGDDIEAYRIIPNFSRKDNYVHLSAIITVKEDTVGIVCLLVPRNSEESIAVELPVIVKNPVAPKILTNQTDIEFGFDERTPTLTCTAVGVPIPSISWRKKTPSSESVLFGKSREIENFEEVSTTSRLDLSFEDEDPETGPNEYICVVVNEEGEDRKSFLASKKEGPKYFRNAVLVASPLILAILLVTSLWWRKRKIEILTKEEVQAFIDGIEISSMSSSCELNALEKINAEPYDANYEIPQEMFKIFPSNILGSGEFGLVLKGVVKGKDVAVKTVKSHIIKEQVLSLLSELKIMIHLGKHKHLVQLVGANTENSNFGRVYLFTEFCLMGSLESFLRKSQTQFNGNYNRTEGLYENIQDGSLLCLWSAQIAQGMSYLAEKNIVHADLATRNVLMMEIRWLKISDFGLSRQLFNNVYTKIQEGKLPWRWMAPESLTRREFSVASDVWGYGVTLWEIYSLGSIPFSGINFDQEMLFKLENGLHLLKPALANDEIYGMICKCWEPLKECRPSFATLYNYFSTKLAELESSVKNLKSFVKKK